MSRGALSIALVCVAATQAAAQSTWHFSAAAAGARELVHLRAGGVDSRLTGSVFGGEAQIARGSVVARLRYGQGSLSGDTLKRDVAVGEALLGYEARTWLTLWLGPAARTFTPPGLSDRRWMFWTARASARGGIFPGKLDGFAELWQGLGGRLSRPDAAASGGGAEFGLEARPARALRARLAYRVEQGRAGGGLRETVEGFTLTVGVTR